MFLLSSEVGDLFEQLTFWIAKLAYTLIGSMYKLFFSLANAQLFNNELISSFTNRVYYIIGVVMLFVFVYIILTNIINPDGGKGKNSPISVIKNVVIALAIIVFTPSMFELAYSVQSSVFENNVIGRLVLGSSSSDTQTYDSANGFVSTLINSSFSVDSDAPEGALIDLENAEYLLSYDGDFSGYEGLINSSNEYIRYNGLISLIVACFCGYVLIGYLLDVAIRAFKLGFLQVIAPVPAILSIVPNQTKILSSWIKETLKTFFEVFLKIAILMFVVFMIGQVNNNLSDIFGNNGFFYKAFVILGLFSFVKVIPKLLSQIFGFSDANSMFKSSKDVLKPFISRTAGVAGSIRGTHEGINARLAAGQKISNKDKALSYLGSAGGALLWSNDGLKSYGRRSKYSLAAQRVKARGGSTFSVWLNASRGAFGLDSYDDEQIEIIELRTDAEVATARQFISDSSRVESSRNKELEVYDEVTKELNDEKTLISSIMSNAKIYLQKPTTTYKSFATEKITYYDSKNNKILTTDNPMIFEDILKRNNGIETYEKNLLDAMNKRILSPEEFSDCLTSAYLNSEIVLPFFLKDENGNVRTSKTIDIQTGKEKIEPIKYTLNCNKTSLADIEKAKNLMEKAYENREISIEEYNETMLRLNNASKSILNHFLYDSMTNEENCKDMEIRSLIHQLNDQISNGVFGRDINGLFDDTIVNGNFVGDGNYRAVYDYFDNLEKYLKNTIAKTSTLKHDELYKIFPDENGNTTFVDPFTGETLDNNLYNRALVVKKARRVEEEALERAKNRKAQYIGGKETNSFLEKYRSSNNQKN